MPGERLMCVWEAVYTEDTVRTSREGPPRDLLRRVTASLKCKSLRFRRDTFDKTLPKEPVAFSDYTCYVEDVLREPDSPMSSAMDDIERICWSACEQTYDLSDMNFESHDLHQLWQVFLRLLDTSKYPPTINGSHMAWMVDRVATSLNRTDKIPSRHIPSEQRYDFCGFVRTLYSHVFCEHDRSETCQAISELHAWLVQEICMSGWLEKRTRKVMGGWTSRRRRWFVLTPGMLAYYDNEQCTERKGEVVILYTTKLEGFLRRKASFTGAKMLGVFKITNKPYLEIELTPPDKEALKTWLVAIRKVIETAGRKSTPIQELLEEMLAEEKSTRVDDESSADVKLRRLHKAAMNTKRVASGLPEVPASPRLGKPEELESDLFHLGALVQQRDDDDNDADESLFEWHMSRLQADFRQTDTTGKGYLTCAEFSHLIRRMGVNNVSDDNIAAFYAEVELNDDGKLDFKAWLVHLVACVLCEQGHDNRLYTALVSARRPEDEGFSVRAFIAFLWEKRRETFSKTLTSAINNFVDDDKERYSFRRFITGSKSMSCGDLGQLTPSKESHANITLLEYCLGMANAKLDLSSTVQELHARWRQFRNQHAHFGEKVVGPTECLVDWLYNRTRTFIPPNHCLTIKVTGQQEAQQDRKRKLFVSGPELYSLPVLNGTSDNLQYYGCAFATTTQLHVSLLNRHDLEDRDAERSDSEKHSEGTTSVPLVLESCATSLMLCPLSDDAGLLVLGSLTPDGSSLRLSGIRVPQGQTVYIPPKTFLSHCLRKGTWKCIKSLADSAPVCTDVLIAPGAMSDTCPPLLLQEGDIVEDTDAHCVFTIRL